MANIVPEKEINFAVYNGGDLLGIAEGTLPNLEFMTSEVQGAGLAGVVDSPTLGHFNSMTLTLNWRTQTSEALRLAAQKAHELDLFSSNQYYDAGLGEYVTKQLHIFCKAVPKNFTLGNLAVNDSSGTETEFEILYMKIELDGKERIEVDKFNYIYKVDGVDYLAGVRANLGKL